LKCDDEGVGLMFSGSGLIKCWK